MANKPKHVFVSGGMRLFSWKRHTLSIFRAILESRGLKVTILKLDPYINLDPGTMSPFQHGEVFV